MNNQVDSAIDVEINKFDTLPRLAKYMVLNQAKAMKEIHHTNSEILQSCYKEGVGLCVECIIGDIAILKNIENPTNKFGFCLKAAGGWWQSCCMAESIDKILLVALEEKYGGRNFALNASRMLDMD